MINSDSIAIIINDVNANSAAKFRRIKVSDMFGDKSIKAGFHLVIWNESDCNEGECPISYNVKSGFSNDFKFATKGMLGRNISEIVITGSELYCTIEMDLPNETYVTFDEAIRRCFR